MLQYIPDNFSGSEGFQWPSEKPWHKLQVPHPDELYAAATVLVRSLWELLQILEQEAKQLWFVLCHSLKALLGNGVTSVSGTLFDKLGQLVGTAVKGSIPARIYLEGLTSLRYDLKRGISP